MDETVRIDFMHYDSFQEAKEKWKQRCNRVDLNNIYIIFHNSKYTSPFCYEYRLFRKLPYKNKVMFTFPLGLFDRSVKPIWPHKLLRLPGKILLYPHLYSKKRYMDRFDFVKFLNRGHEDI